MFLTEEQHQIVKLAEQVATRERTCIQIEARAGSGKTTTLVAIHKKLLESGRHVLALSFSRTGEHRYNLMLNGAGYQRAKPRNLCRTMESFAGLCLAHYSTRKRWERGQLGESVNHRSEAVVSMRRVVEDLNENRSYQGGDTELLPVDEISILSLLDLVESMKTSLIFQTRFAHLEYEEMTDEDVEDMQLYLESLGLPDYSYSLYKRYENLRDGRDFLRFGDASYDLAKEPEAVTAYVKSRSKAPIVLIDEFHDVQPSQYAVIEALRKAGCSIIVVGDEGQDIFSWRGVKPFSAFESFRRIPGVYTMPLTQTFRFGNPLCQLASQKLARAIGANATIIPAPHRTEVEICENMPLDEVVESLVRDLPKDVKGGFALMAIYPSGAMSYGLMQALCKRGIFYRAHNMAAYHEAREVRLCRALAMVYGWGPTEYVGDDVLAMIELLRLPIFQTSRYQVEIIIAGMRETGGDYGNSVFYVTAGISPALDFVHGIIQYEPTECSAPNIEAISKHLGIQDWLASKTYTKELGADSLRLFQETCAILAKVGGEAFIQHLNINHDHYETGSKRADISITTVLQSKGLEWATVILPIKDGSGGWINHFSSQNSLRRKELYVALTRAREKVVLASDVPINDSALGLAG